MFAGTSCSVKNDAKIPLGLENNYFGLKLDNPQNPNLLKNKNLFFAIADKGWKSNQEEKEKQFYIQTIHDVKENLIDVALEQFGISKVWGKQVGFSSSDFTGKEVLQDQKKIKAGTIYYQYLKIQSRNYMDQNDYKYLLARVKYELNISELLEIEINQLEKKLLDFYSQPEFTCTNGQLEEDEKMNLEMCEKKFLSSPIQSCYTLCNLKVKNFWGLDESILIELHKENDKLILANLASDADGFETYVHRIDRFSFIRKIKYLIAKFF